MSRRQQLLAELSDILVEEFEIERDDIQPDANLYEDLDLDSIDAVDLVIKLQQSTGVKIQPDEFKAVRTVNDVLDALEQLVPA
ncbi:acyl carrier protein [Ferrimonas balearica]|uniref:acyl carrier protein n=1 Tax=Ferrimonas balearica TaxID=44012 RepID=UPI001C56A996|nr:acyl carrier protein [Ferrimonas balearica]MBW3164030.1 acyl carrier protein [Ferrimonas balearica]MBY6224012.1 acyl carrier protein [Ferrimonas balearica]